MIDVLPGILAHDAMELREKLFFPGFWQPGMTAHIDILDGSMFGATCFCDPVAITPPATPYTLRTTHCPTIELHCMVQNPIPIIEQWKSIVPETMRAIIHAEIEKPMTPMLHRIHELGLESGIALCPKTTPDVLASLPFLPDRILIMGVEPGASGKPFLGEPILAKIRRTRTLYPSITIAVDGGTRPEIVPSILTAGANAVIATSAIWSAKRPDDAYQQLAHSLSLHDTRPI